MGDQKSGAETKLRIRRTLHHATRVLRLKRKKKREKKCTSENEKERDRMRKRVVQSKYVIFLLLPGPCLNSLHKCWRREKIDYSPSGPVSERPGEGNEEETGVVEEKIERGRNAYQRFRFLYSFHSQPPKQFFLMKRQFIKFGQKLCTFGYFSLLVVVDNLYKLSSSKKVPFQ